MMLLANIYKMNLPFGEGSLYDKTNYFAALDELENFLKYENLYTNTQKKVTDAFEIKTLFFTGGKIVGIFYKTHKDSFYPSFQIDCYGEDIPGNRFIKAFCGVFDGIGREQYICDFIDEVTPVGRLLTEDILSKSFKKFNYRELEIFIKNSEIGFIEEKLSSNPDMKNYLFYLFYLNYLLFKNIALSDGGIQELESYLGIDINDELLGYLSLSKERIEHISGVNLQVFKKYKEMLDRLVALIKLQ